MNHHPLRKSTKKKPKVNNYIEMPEKKEQYQPGDKYKEPKEMSLYEFLDVEAFRNELKEIEEDRKLKAINKPWYRKFITLLTPFGVKEDN